MVTLISRIEISTKTHNYSNSRVNSNLKIRLIIPDALGIEDCRKRRGESDNDE